MRILTILITLLLVSCGAQTGKDRTPDPWYLKEEQKLGKLEEIIATYENLTDAPYSVIDMTDIYTRSASVEAVVLGDNISIPKVYTWARDNWTIFKFGNDYKAIDLSTVEVAPFVDFLMGNSSFPIEVHAVDVVPHLENDFIGGGMYFSEDTDSTKDLEGMASKIEDTDSETMTDRLISYGMSSDRALKLGKSNPSSTKSSVASLKSMPVKSWVKKSFSLGVNALLFFSLL